MNLRYLLAIVLASLGSAARVAAVEPLLFGGHGACAAATDGDSEDKEHTCYGPCDGQPPKTLLQWSHCASFSGGPPGRDEPLVTDRPDFVEASKTVGQGIVQLEMGYTYSFDHAGGTSTIDDSYPETLLRVGLLAEWLELRVGWNYARHRVRSGGVQIDSESGSEDMYLGFKLGLTPQEGWLPEMALIPQMTVPTGAAAFTGGEVLPGVNWVYSWDNIIQDFLSLSGGTQLNKAVDDSGADYYEFTQAFSVGYELSERLRAYTEWFMLSPSGAQTARTEHYFDSGFSFLFSNDVQVDIRGGVGLNEAATNYFLGTGLALRF